MSPEKSFTLFNTLSGQVEALQPLTPGHLRFYSCGPTVYSFAHIGNFRSFLTADLIFRTSQEIGWNVSYVTNITDVGHLTEDDVADSGGEDRMAKALQSGEGGRFANVYDLARHYTQILLDDWRALNLIEPTVRPRATEHITEQIRAVEALLEHGIAYETEKGVYFSVAKFPAYGKLSGNLDAQNLEEAVRDVVRDEDKRDPRDFALWKKEPGHLMQWHSPWGWGFPGWHIECSVMSTHYLGEEIDLHAGGEDLIFPHHECEIAQAESLSGKPFARHWVHTRFLQVEGEKMSKSKGNFFTVRDLIGPESEGGKGVDPIALRLALISGQYRKPFNFTFDTLKASIKHVERLRAAAESANAAMAKPDDSPDPIGEQLRHLGSQVLDAMLDDLNTPAAIAAAIEGAKLIQSRGDSLSAASAASAKEFIDTINRLLGIPYAEDENGSAVRDRTADQLSKRVESLIRERNEARRQRDYKRADSIRQELDDLGVEVMDGPAGTTWKRKASV